MFVVIRRQLTFVVFSEEKSDPADDGVGVFCLKRKRRKFLQTLTVFIWLFWAATPLSLRLWQLGNGKSGTEKNAQTLKTRRIATSTRLPAWSGNKSTREFGAAIQPRGQKGSIEEHDGGDERWRGEEGEDVQRPWKMATRKALLGRRRSRYVKNKCCGKAKNNKISK